MYLYGFKTQVGHSGAFVSCEAVTKDRGADGALHAPADPVQAAAVQVGDLSPQQRFLTHQICGDLLPAHGEVLIWWVDKRVNLNRASSPLPFKQSSKVR